MADLTPPRKRVELEDPGAHELDSSGDEHFSDASEGRKPTLDQAGADRSNATSPIPVTRVERVDDIPAHGEVPNTPAYKMRMADAVPDEVEVVPEGQRSRSASSLRAGDRPSAPSSPVPKTVVEKVDPDVPGHGDVPGTDAYELRKADAIPDLILKAPPTPRGDAFPEGSPTVLSRSEHELDEPPSHDNDEEDEAEEDGDGEGFGDDFDDFEEGEQGNDDDDFGDFDDGFAEDSGGGREDGTAFAEESFQPSPVPLAAPPSLRLLDYSNLHSTSDIKSSLTPFYTSLFPSLPSPSPDPPLSTSSNPSLLSSRSSSLWSQLLAPPPLQPPNWLRSRIRRLFLVSLGVPVDLDEILPKSAQKKLVLPSVHLSPRHSADIRRIRNSSANDSSTSLSSSTGGKGDRDRDRDRDKGKGKRMEPPPFDESATMRLAHTTREKLTSFSDRELRAHVAVLEEARERAEEALRFWEERRLSAEGDKEAFEGVIENLVRHARRARK